MQCIPFDIHMVGCLSVNSVCSITMPQLCMHVKWFSIHHVDKFPSPSFSFVPPRHKGFSEAKRLDLTLIHRLAVTHCEELEKNYYWFKSTPWYLATTNVIESSNIFFNLVLNTPHYSEAVVPDNVSVERILRLKRYLVVYMKILFPYEVIRMRSARNSSSSGLQIELTENK